VFGTLFHACRNIDGYVELYIGSFEMAEPKITAQVLRVLAAFVDAGHVELTGAIIHERTGILSGTLYPILIRFRDAGWVSDRWEDQTAFEQGRPKRRYYRLTAAGQRAYQRGMIKAETGAIAWAR
jgi:PadR family transcriptional regulator PadR